MQTDGSRPAECRQRPLWLSGGTACDGSEDEQPLSQQTLCFSTAKPHSNRHWSHQMHLQWRALTVMCMPKCIPARMLYANDSKPSWQQGTAHMRKPKTKPACAIAHDAPGSAAEAVSTNKNQACRVSIYTYCVYCTLRQCVAPIAATVSQQWQRQNQHYSMLCDSCTFAAACMYVSALHCREIREHVTDAVIMIPADDSTPVLAVACACHMSIQAPGLMYRHTMCSADKLHAVSTQVAMLYISKQEQLTTKLSSYIQLTYEGQPASAGNRHCLANISVTA